MSDKISVAEHLKERVKELTCLYEVSSAIRKHSTSVVETLEEICNKTKMAWRFPESAIVELRFEDYHIFTAGIPGSSVFQQSLLTVFGESKGSVKVHYDGSRFQQNHFLPEEQKLLDKIAMEISEFFERRETIKKEELLRRTAERNDRLAILGEITAGIAHELNTPLGNILGFAELINGNTDDLQVKNDAAKIIKAAIYSREVVKKLMFFACEMPQNMEFIQIKPVIEQALALLGQNFKKAGVGYRFDIDNPDLRAQLDAVQFTQVLFNILINAIYISPPDSEISIEVKSTETSMDISIADQGSGISSALKAKVFEPFFTTKPVGEGSGLGLSVVHGIIKTHRGEITTSDNKPSGTIFHIHLPLKA